MDKTIRTGILFAFAAATGYALLPVFTKTIYAHTDALSAVDIAGWRFMMAAPLTWLVVFLRGRVSQNTTATTERLPRLRLLGLGTLLGSAGMVAFYGLSLVDASLFIIIFRTLPVMILLIGWFMGERLPLKGWLALALVMAGVVLVLNPGDVSVQWTRTDFLGVGMALLNALIIAFYTVGHGKLSTQYTAKARATAWTMTGAALLTVPLMLITGATVPPSWVVLASIFGLVVCSTVLPLIAILEGLTRLGASRFAIVNSVEPIIAVFFAFILLGETLLPIQLAGGAIILASVIMLQLPLPWLDRLRLPTRPQSHPAPNTGGD